MLFHNENITYKSIIKLDYGGNDKVVILNKYFKVTMSANNLQNEIQFHFIINALKEIRNNNKRPDNQTNFDHITKTAAASMDHSQIDELISNMLKNGLIYDKPSKKDTSYFIMEATNNDHEKASDNTDVNIGNNNCFARCSNPSSP